MSRRAIGWGLALLAVCLSGPILYAQASAAVTGGAVTVAGRETSEWGSSVVWAFLSTSLLEHLKRKEWFPLLNEWTTWRVQRVLGVLIAGATALGIHVSFQWDASTGHALVDITGLMFTSIFAAAGEWLRQFVFNEVIYRTAIKTYH